MAFRSHRHLLVFGRITQKPEHAAVCSMDYSVVFFLLGFLCMCVKILFVSLFVCFLLLVEQIANSLPPPPPPDGEKGELCHSKIELNTCKSQLVVGKGASCAALCSS